MTTKATILKAIRHHCIECMGGQPSLVTGCTSPNCNLFSYRLGKDPKKRPMSDERRAKQAENLEAARKAKNAHKTEVAL